MESSKRIKIDTKADISSGSGRDRNFETRGDEGRKHEIKDQREPEY